jgi:hypothetical protein
VLRDPPPEFVGDAEVGRLFRHMVLSGGAVPTYCTMFSRNSRGARVLAGDQSPFVSHVGRRRAVSVRAVVSEPRTETLHHCRTRLVRAVTRAMVRVRVVVKATAARVSAVG